MKTITGLLLLAFFVGISGCCFFQPLEKKSRHPTTIVLRIEDTNGVAQVGVHLQFSEYGWRYLVPIPFGSPLWMSSGSPRDVTSDAAGNATVNFHDDRLTLHNISAGGQTVTNYTIISYRIDGSSWTNDYHVYVWTLVYNAYSQAKEDYTIRIQK